MLSCALFSTPFVFIILTFYSYKFLSLCVFFYVLYYVLSFDPPHADFYNCPLWCYSVCPVLPRRVNSDVTRCVVIYNFSIYNFFGRMPKNVDGYRWKISPRSFLKQYPFFSENQGTFSKNCRNFSAKPSTPNVHPPLSEKFWTRSGSTVMIS